MRILWGAGLIAGASYCLAAWFGWAGPWVTVWKGAGVGLLAAWATARARTVDDGLLALMLVFYATGDVLLDVVGLAIGAIAFLIGHLFAIALFLRNGRARPSGSQRLLGRLLGPLTVVIAVALVWRTGSEMAAGIYAGVLGVMAATAWLSRFPRYRTGVGAILFVASDLLIFARAGPLGETVVPTLLVWPLHFGGVALMVWGIRAVRRAPFPIFAGR
ncbi:lysoplasmalogenase family protein [Stakelama saccharophila]|uniref:Lysoplasmalogenase family protein n=1 Tax=Stakelama saccharophila TaxID=3075605 RepID=A0ABZ0BCP3_9SPHN|nr:lysoplasmalogenase family protein [Stakelama sp. W311]WNO55054.1 lysoplasmalogenase family protein [Stakelama sp. W311]